MISVGRARRKCVARLLTCVTPHDNDSMETGGKNVARLGAVCRPESRIRLEQWSCGKDF